MPNESAPPPPNKAPLFPLFKINFCSPPWHAKRRLHQTFHGQTHLHACIGVNTPELLYPFIFRHLIAGGLFSPSLKTIWTIQSAPSQKKKTARLVVPYWCSYQLSSWTKAEQESRTAKPIYPNRCVMVQYLAASTRTLGPVHSWRGWGAPAEVCSSILLYSFCF